MKKKVLLLALTVTVMASLTACGNPQKKLPAESDSSIWNESEESTGNDAADAIFEELEDNGALKGDVTSFTVYKRKDSDDNKQKSDLYVEVVTETKAAKYTNHYVCKMSYNKESKKWKVKEYSLDEKEDSIVEPLVKVDDDMCLSALQENTYWLSNYYGDTYLYVTSDNLTSVTVNEANLDKKAATCQADVTYVVDGGYAVYSRDASIDFTFDAYDEKWRISDVTTESEFEMELSAETEEAFAGDKILADLVAYKDSYQVGNFYYDFADVTVSDYEVTDLSINGSSAEVTYNMTIDGGLAEVNVSFDLDYYYSTENGWYLSWATGYPTCSVESVDLNGNYEAHYVGYSSDYDTQVYLSITDVEQEGNGGTDYNVTGAIRCITDDGKDTTATFTCKFYCNNFRLYSFDFDGKAYYTKYSYFDSWDSFYLDLGKQCFRDSSSYFVFSEME